MRLPRKFAPQLYGIIQSAITTGVATAIAAYQLATPGAAMITRWVTAWVFAWLTMLPIVLFAAPLIQRAVQALTDRDPSGREK